MQVYVSLAGVVVERGSAWGTRVCVCDLRPLVANYFLRQSLERVINYWHWFIQCIIIIQYTVWSYIAQP